MIMSDIFGVTDGDEEHEIMARKNRKLIPENKLGKRKTITIQPPPPKTDPKDLATNVVELLEEDLQEFKEDLEQLTKDYTDLLRKEVVPHLLALDAAVDYTKALMVDGLGREDVSTDNSLIITLKWLLLGNFIKAVTKKYELQGNNHFDERLADLMKADLAKASAYNDPNTVGVVKSMEGSGLGVRASMRRRD